jgi:hypothetical protein
VSRINVIVRLISPPLRRRRRLRNVSTAGVWGGAWSGFIHHIRMVRAGRAVLSASRTGWVVKVPVSQSSVSAFRHVRYCSPTSVTLLLLLFVAGPLDLIMILLLSYIYPSR